MVSGLPPAIENSAVVQRWQTVAVAFGDAEDAGSQFTIHLAAVAATAGPIHGNAYLAVVACVLLLPGATRPRGS